VEVSEDSAAVESSENDSESSSDWDDGWATGTAKKARGRRRSRSESGGTDRMGREIVTAQSLFKTAKEEGMRALAESCRWRRLIEGQDATLQRLS
jgi:hypothetical protein